MVSKTREINMKTVQATATTMPFKPFVDVLPGLSDLKISDIGYRKDETVLG